MRQGDPGKILRQIICCVEVSSDVQPVPARKKVLGQRQRQYSQVRIVTSKRRSKALRLLSCRCLRTRKQSMQRQCLASLSLL